MTAAADRAVLAALAAGASTLAEVRSQSSLSAGEARDAVQRLRWKGKIKFDRLELSESQRAEMNSADCEVAEASAPQDNPGPAEPEGGAGGAEAGPAATPAPPEAPVDLPGASASAAARRGPWKEVSITAGPLLAEIAAYLERHGLTRSRFGYASNGDYGLIQRLENAGIAQPRTIAKVRAFIAAHPEGLPAKPPRAKRGGATKEQVIDRPEHGPAPSDPPPVSETAPAQACPEGPDEGAAAESVAAPTAVEPGREVFDPRPAPAPVHEPEVALARPERTPRPFERVRAGDPANRALANPHLPPAIGRGRKRIGLPSGLEPIEQLQSMLAETPADLIRVVNRKHPELWARVIALGRVRGERPALALYAAIEAGLLALEEDEREEREAAE